MIVSVQLLSLSKRRQSAILRAIGLTSLDGFVSLPAREPAARDAGTCDF